jgi:tRNA (guanosine-2'-O-)-methyltransferase
LFVEDFDISKPSALFLEQRRIIRRNLQRADIFKIPMVGFTESLNISVSAAIIIQPDESIAQFKHRLALIRN